MTVSIVHVGLPLDHPSIPAEERPKLAKRLSDLQERMRGAGYNYEFLYCSPEDGVESFKHRLETQPCDGVLLGGGIVSNPEMSRFLEQIVDATHQMAPKSKIMFHNHSIDVQETIERGFRARTHSGGIVRR